MRLLARTLGMAVLAAALLNASAGLCFCHHGPDAPASRPGHSCCRPSADEDALVVGAAESCCHIESVQRDATPVDAIQLAAPPESAADRLALAAETIPHPALRPAASPSPPIQVLRL